MPRSRAIAVTGSPRLPTGPAGEGRTHGRHTGDQRLGRRVPRRAYRRSVDTSTAIASNPAELTACLAALADPVRLRIVGVLGGGSRCVCDLHEKVPVAANLLSYHLRVLRDAGLVTAARRGRWIDYRLDGDGFAALWGQASAAGVPLSGDHGGTAWRVPSCDATEVGR